MAKKENTKIIVVAHHKGGVGKTTIAVNLAHTYVHDLKLKVALVDLDTQGSSKRLASFNNLYTSDEAFNPYEYDIVINDTPPYLSDELFKVMKSADLVIVPARPNPADLDTLPDTIALIERAKLQNPKLQAALVISQLDRRNSMWDDLKPYFLKLDIPLLVCQVENRVSYARSLIDDDGIFSQDDKKAQQEMSNLVIEINKLLNIKY